MRLASVGFLVLALGCSGSPGDGDAGPSGMDGGVDAGARDASSAGSDGGGGVDAGHDAAPGDAGPPACHPGFSFEPAAPETGALLWVTFVDADRGWAWIGLEVTGPGSAEVGHGEVVSGSPPYEWRFPVAITGGGRYDVAFTAEMPTRTIGTCAIEVAETGAPPPLPVGPCEGRVCGDDDGMGGTCSRCPMVEAEGGACLDPPAPIGPGGEMAWSCLDSASCDPRRGMCRIWCPGEPCDMARHPDGCPQGVEACWVPATISDYEEACRQCCEGRYHAPTDEYACWDSAVSLCRYPGDCGMPYPLP